MRIEIRIGRDGKVTARAIDLAGDLWRDFRDYLAEAQEFESRGDMRRRNRALRSGLVCLYSHLEGVVTAIYRKLPQADPGKRDPSLCKRIDAICEKLPDVRRLHELLRLKLLRDIVAHPSKIEVDETAPEAMATRWPEIDRWVKTSEVNTFHLTVEGLGSEGELIDGWLRDVCHRLKYDRFPDLDLPLDRICSRMGGKQVQSFEM